MPVDRVFWRDRWFTKERTPAWRCPTCNHGVLRVEKSTLHEDASAVYTAHQADPDWGPEIYSGAFCCLLRCSNDDCKEIVAASGLSEMGEESGEYGGWVTCFEPRMFTPPLNLIVVPQECPEDAAKEIRNAFKLFWCDLAGGANHLRKAVELILNHLKIRKGGRDKKGRLKPLSLHDRIVLFRAKDAALADRLEAVKWLGNVGSHPSDISQDQFFDAIDLLEDFIRTHFEKHGKKIIAIVKRVIKSKGKR